MYEERRVVYLHALTPAHPGTGQDIGAVDLPVQREVHTGLPYIQASGIKGSWRESVERDPQSDSQLIKAAFGPDPASAHEHAGALSFSDGKLLLFPVRSLVGMVAWVTSPMVWSRLVRDVSIVGSNTPPPPPALEAGSVACASKACLKDEKIVLESYAFSAAGDGPGSSAASSCAQWLKGEGALEPNLAAFIAERIVFVPDDLLRDLTVHGAQIVSRITLGEEGTTSSKGGNLWYEELIPADTIFYVTIFARDGTRSQNRYQAEEIIGLLERRKPLIQIGGEASIGRGLFRCTMSKASK